MQGIAFRFPPVTCPQQTPSIARGNVTTHGQITESSIRFRSGIGGHVMILPALTGLSLVVLAANSPLDLDHSVANLSTHQKTVAVQPLVRRATECVAKSVAADPRAGTLEQPGVLGDLIVASMPSCADLMRAMIDGFDRYFGNGSGEAYFSGPYLDALPSAVSKLAEELKR